MKKRIITTADDYGACHFIDKGIRKAAEAGVISCVSAFVTFKKRGRNIPGGAYPGSIAALQRLQADFPQLPIGLHLTINAGEPVADPADVPDLGFHGHAANNFLFHDIADFNPRKYQKKKMVRQIEKEIAAQIDLFEQHLGEPNHISCHFGVVFQFIKILKNIIEKNKFSRTHVRNPILAWQTIAERKDPNAAGIKKLQKTFKATSKMRAEGLKKGMKWIDDLATAGTAMFSVTNKKRRIKKLQQQNILFPDYTYGYLYKRGKDFKSLQYLIDNMPTFMPLLYQAKRKTKTPVHEIICHLGDGQVPFDSPNGVDLGYFTGRKVELQRLLQEQQALQAHNVDLVNFQAIK